MRPVSHLPCQPAPGTLPHGKRCSSLPATPRSWPTERRTAPRLTGQAARPGLSLAGSFRPRQTPAFELAEGGESL